MIDLFKRKKVTDSNNLTSFLTQTPVMSIDDEGFIKLAKSDDRPYFSEYMNLLQIEGLSLYYMSNDDIINALYEYGTWIEKFGEDFTIETIKLPTDVSNQIKNLQIKLATIESEIKSVINTRNPDKRKVLQLQDQKTIIKQSIAIQELARDSIMNTDYILYIFGDSLDEIKKITRKALGLSNAAFSLKECSTEKKKAILKKYNNVLS